MTLFSSARITHRGLNPTAVAACSLLLILMLAPVITRAGTEPLTYEAQTLMVGGAPVVARVPKGYRLSLLTDKLDGPRLMTFAENGDLFIGSSSGMVYRLAAPYTTPEVLVTLNNYPHSIAIRHGEILIARTDGLYRAPYQPDQKELPAASVSLLARLPGGGGHNSRSVGIGPDGRVYLSLGIQSNCSDQYLDSSYPFDERRGGIVVLREANGKAQWEVFASGLRNPVGFAWQPRSGVMYASNNGPDHLGYEQPPEYFSRITAGSFHGMPWFQFDGQRLHRDDCATKPPPRPMAEVTSPVATFPARNAPMGVTFIPQGAMSKALSFDAIVALHGSWATQSGGGFFGVKATRRPPKLVAVRFNNGEVVRVDDIVTGFQLANGERWARPVGVAIGPDGALYFTSDGGAHGLFRLGLK